MLNKIAQDRAWAENIPNWETKIKQLIKEADRSIKNQQQQPKVHTAHMTHPNIHPQSFILNSKTTYTSTNKAILKPTPLQQKARPTRLKHITPLKY
jgi:hypothetical protein